MTHSLAQEITMLTEFTTIESAEELVSSMKDKVMDKGGDPVEILEEMGIRPLPVWISELRGDDELLDWETPEYENEE